MQFDPANIAEILTTMDKDATLNPKFSDLSISLGDHPDVREEHRGRSCKDGTLGAQTTFLPSQYGNRALMAICQPSFEFYYSLQDVSTLQNSFRFERRLPLPPTTPPHVLKTDNKSDRKAAGMGFDCAKRQTGSRLQL